MSNTMLKGVQEMRSEVLISDWLLKAPDLNPIIQVNSKRLISSSFEGDKNERLCVAVDLENIHVPTFFKCTLCDKLANDILPQILYIEPDFYFFFFFSKTCRLPMQKLLSCFKLVACVLFGD